MGLRDLKRSGGYLTQSPPIGEWGPVTGPGELARCPMPDCGRGLLQPGIGSQVAVRVAMEGIGEEDQPCAFMICQASQCKARLEIRLFPAR